jgi:hypothetical protein
MDSIGNRKRLKVAAVWFKMRFEFKNLSFFYFLVDRGLLLACLLTDMNRNSGGPPSGAGRGECG